jgi:hypothetical protein
MIVLLFCFAVVIVGEACAIADLQSTLGRFEQSFFEDKTIKSNIMLIPNHCIYVINFSTMIG